MNTEHFDTPRKNAIFNYYINNYVSVIVGLEIVLYAGSLYEYFGILMVVKHSVTSLCYDPDNSSNFVSWLIWSIAVGIVMLAVYMWRNRLEIDGRVFMDSNRKELFGAQPTETRALFDIFNPNTEAGKATATYWDYKHKSRLLNESSKWIFINACIATIIYGHFYTPQDKENDENKTFWMCAAIGTFLVAVIVFMAKLYVDHIALVYLRKNYHLLTSEQTRDTHTPQQEKFE